ncbi:MAG: hypothetical protein NTY19_06795 [Planctomycetota bacterium]|nr:hypothetical protein [Planctomycetota bacterium]
MVIRTAGSHLLTTHLHDNLGGGDSRLPIPKTDLHLAVGLGTIHWPATVRALDEIEYKGPAVIEGTRIGPKDTGEQDWQRSVSDVHRQLAGDRGVGQKYLIGGPPACPDQTEQVGGGCICRAARRCGRRSLLACSLTFGVQQPAEEAQERHCVDRERL